MSTTITVIIFAVLLIAGCFGSWRAALMWNNRTRGARSEDPRDQEIRELAAALSVARKEVDTLKRSSGGHAYSATQLEEKLQKSEDALASTRKSLQEAKDSLDKEIEDKDVIQANFTRLSNELSQAKQKLSEYEVQVGINDNSGSGFVAGLDEMVDDDEKEVFIIRQEHKLLKEQVKLKVKELETASTETDRWKKHCTVMTRNNKELKSRVDSFSDIADRIGSLEEKATQLAELRAEHKNLQKDMDIKTGELDSVKSEFDNVSKDLDAARETVASLETVETENTELKTKVDELSAQLPELDTLRQEKQTMQQRLEILEQVREENEQMTARIEALDKIQEENESLNVRVRKLQQFEKGHAELQQCLEELNKADAELKETLSRKETQLQELETQADENSAFRNKYEAARKRITELESLESDADKLRSELQQLGDVAVENERLKEELASLHQTREEAEELQQQVAELSKTGDEVESLRDKLAQLSDAQASADEHLTHEQQENARLREELEELSRAGEHTDKESVEIEERLALEMEETRALRQRVDELKQELKNRKAVEAFDDVQPEQEAVEAEPDEAVENTDSMPALDPESFPENDEDRIDDLQLIKGVGAKLEEKLNKAGIRNFQALLEMNDEDYKRAEKLIPTLQSRIKRDDWLTQARQLHKDKYDQSV